MNTATKCPWMSTARQLQASVHTYTRHWVSCSDPRSVPTVRQLRAHLEALLCSWQAVPHLQNKPVGCVREHPHNSSAANNASGNVTERSAWFSRSHQYAS